MMNDIVFVDTEVNPKTQRIMDYGAIRMDYTYFHDNSPLAFAEFIAGHRFIGGHNILEHDLKYIERQVKSGQIRHVVDTLYLSVLLFPCRPYHALVKDDKLQNDTLNNPLNDSIKAKELFHDEENAYGNLSPQKRDIYGALLSGTREFSGFFEYVNWHKEIDAASLIRQEFQGLVCEHVKLETWIERYPVEMAYCLALIGSGDKYAVIPRWVNIRFPAAESVMRALRNTPCAQGCAYCRKALDIHVRLKQIFGYDGFRSYNGEPLQEKAARAAAERKSLLAVFPTGGGKSITFQLPALIAGEASRGLTVVISPLQSLMKDQVDNLEKKGIVDGVAINGLLTPVERSEALERVESGLASILYISPESLRSKTIERLLLARTVERFVIDEAHCFSAWGQDFRVDYLYIGDFIRSLQEKKNLNCKIPISCFTATAKQKVISDIREYFKEKLGLDLEIYATNAARSNLRYEVLHRETDEEKYAALRALLEKKECPAIVYVSRTKRTEELAKKLTRDGFAALPFNGKMDAHEKEENQNAFIQDRVRVMVATSAFGMGVDKSNVGLVVHYDISDSLENYVQEAGRAGRDQSLMAECYVLFNENDLDRHFILLNQTKLSISEIQQIWKVIKELTKNRESVCRSALELARMAGWDDSGEEIETRVRTAVAALENAGYIQRGQNVPHVYATGILAKNMAEASGMIERSGRFNDEQKQAARRILQMLIASRSRANAGNDEAESRVDYISDRLGISKPSVVEAIQLMREEGLLADTKDLTAYIRRSDTKNKSGAVLKKYRNLEEFLLEGLKEGLQIVHVKELNEQAMAAGVNASTVNAIKTIFYFWTIKKYIQKNVDAASYFVRLKTQVKPEVFKERRRKALELAQFIVEYLYERSMEKKQEKEEVLVLFSVLELKNAYENQITLWGPHTASAEEIEEALLYLSKIDSMKLEGGFLVLYNAMEIKRLVPDNKIRYKLEDYRQLEEFYQQKMQQIHIVGEYANMMVRDYEAALRYVSDYFQMDYRKFLNQYFKEERKEEIGRNITPAKYAQLFGALSPVQARIIGDDKSRHIVVAAGPGSGKTRVLVHKLAALILLEDVKHEQMLMVTFSRAAVTEFKRRLMELIGNAAFFVEIKTFHSYCFDLLGKIGTLEASGEVVKNAAEMIRNGEAETGRMTKTVVVIDEAQDMDRNEFALIRALMEKNEEMRIIAVGDDDQNIYSFRGSDSGYFAALVKDYGAVLYEMTENYRSKRHIVDFANAFAKTITCRMKSDFIHSTQAEEGLVKLTRHAGGHLEEPVVNELIRNSHDGTVCVLANTNQEALQVMGLLVHKGIAAKLIQSDDKFNLQGLAEIRYFLERIEKELRTPVISDRLWEESMQSLEQNYAKSACLPLCRELLKSFEQTNRTKYKTDLEMFIHESGLEDFCHGEKGTVLVSTIHKSKGKEFDTVYMMLNKVAANTDEERRKLYVGLTRAKSRLYIHCNNGLFDGIHPRATVVVNDTCRYGEPSELMLQLHHGDVILSFFKDKKESTLRLRSGMELQPDRHGLKHPESGAYVLKFSQKCKAFLDNLLVRGYCLYKAKVRYIVMWHDKKEEQKAETAIILPDIYLRKRTEP